MMSRSESEDYFCYKYLFGYWFVSFLLIQMYSLGLGPSLVIWQDTHDFDDYYDFDNKMIMKLNMNILILCA